MCLGRSVSRSSKQQLQASARACVAQACPSLPAHDMLHCIHGLVCKADSCYCSRARINRHALHRTHEHAVRIYDA
eukprot:2775835-Alexandrium_andersonii.AAC.1